MRINLKERCIGPIFGQQEKEFLSKKALTIFETKGGRG
jgi:hypothetical protein